MTVTVRQDVLAPHRPRRDPRRGGSGGRIADVRPRERREAAPEDLPHQVTSSRALRGSGRAPRGCPRPAVDVRAPARAHRLEVVAALVRVANHLGEQLGAAGRDDDAAADSLDHLGGLALRVGRDDDRPAGGHDPVQPARHDEAGEALGEPDEVQVVPRTATSGSTSRAWYGSERSLSACSRSARRTRSM